MLNFIAGFIGCIIGCILGNIIADKILNKKNKSVKNNSRFIFFVILGN